MAPADPLPDEALVVRGGLQKTARIEVDFNEYDRDRREIPISRASMETIQRSGIAMREGLLLQLHSADLDDDGNPADLVVDGQIRFDVETGRWVAHVDPSSFRHVAHPVQVSQLER